MVVHGDDFTALANAEDIFWLRSEFSRHYEIKFRGVLGPNRVGDEVTEMSVLNRIFRWTSAGIEYEADPRHAEIIINELGLTNCRPVATPGVKPNKGESGEPLLGVDATKFRACVARAKYLAQDPCNIAYSVKVLTRCMSNPTTVDVMSLKRLGRYLVGRQRLVN